MPFRFDHPGLLWLLLLAAPVVLLGWWGMSTLDPVRRYTAIALRLIVLFILVMILAGLQLVRTHSDLTVIAVVDTSESARRFAKPPEDVAGRIAQTTGADDATVRNWAQSWLGAAGDNRKPDDRVGLITFDGKPTVASLPSVANQFDEAALSARNDGTDTAAAIRLAMAMFPSDSGKRMVLWWDGNDTASAQGTGRASDVLTAAREARAAGIPIDVVPLEYHVADEVMVESIYAPPEARRGQTVPLRVVLTATRPSSGLLFLKRDDVLIDLAPGVEGAGAPISDKEWTKQTAATRSSTAPGSDQNPPDADPTQPASEGAAPTYTDRYLLVRLVEVPILDTGPSRFEAIFEPATGSDTMAGNNSAEAFTMVHGQGRILFVNNVPGSSGTILPKTLEERGIELEVIEPAVLPDNLTTLLRYDAVILQNVPADMITVAQNKMLARYVNDMGGGLVMIGGADSFGAGGWTNSPVDRILPVECEIPSQTILPSGALVIVIDRSGSMGGSVAGSQYNQQEVANEAAVQAISTLYPQDLVGVVGFDDSAIWIVGNANQLSYNTNPGQIASQIRSIHPGGGTNIFPGLEQAHYALAKLGPQDAAVKHVILLTDGQSNDGAYYEVIGKMQQAGITLSTVGVGDGMNNTLLQQLALMGGGNFYAVPDPLKLPQIFIKEARLVRKNLIKETPFTPKFVQTGSPVMAGMSSSPELQGFVLTGRKYDPRVFTPMEGPEGEPVFAHWQVGLGRAAAFTSDATNKWAVNWLPWGGYPDFWARTVRMVARPSSSRALDLLATIQGDTLKVRLDATAGQDATATPTGEAGFINFLNVRGKVLGPDGEMTDIRFEQTGPGVYEATAPADKSGNYILSLFAQGPPGTQPVTVFGGASKSRGPELRNFSSDRGLIEQVAMISGGRVLDATLNAAAGSDIFSRATVVESRSLRALWPTLVTALLALFLLDVAARRIAWDVPAMAGWATGRLDAVLGLLQPRKIDTDATLSALKRKAAETDRKLSGEKSAADKLPGVASASASGAAAKATPTVNVDTKRKFEADVTFEADDDFAQSVGGAREEDLTVAGPAAQTRAKSPTDEPQTHSRLLDAKRRAQKRLDEKET